MSIKTKLFDYDKNTLLYWQSIKNYPVPSPEEEEQLFKMVLDGDEEAKNKLIMGHQRIIFSMAKQYAKSNSEIIDYVNEGTIGLMKAIDTYDITRGFRFITYAMYYIKREMNAYYNNTNHMVYSSNVHKYQVKLRLLKKQFCEENGYEPTPEEIIRLFKEKYDITIKNSCDLYSIIVNDIVFDDEDEINSTSREIEFNKASCSYNDYETESNNDFIKYVLNKSLTNLKERERDIIEMFFGVGKYDTAFSIDDIAEKYNTSTTNIGAIKRNTLLKLKDILPNKIAV